MEHDHTPEGIALRLSRGARHSYLRDFVYGGIDGAVTTFAVVSGVVGAELSLRSILILGIANLIADGFSMAASNFLGTKAERDEFRRLKKFEDSQVRLFPEGEREEVRQIFKRKGLEGEVLEQVVATITSDPEKWVHTMLTEEYGLPADIRSPWRAASYTWCAFLFCGAVPLLPYILGFDRAFEWAGFLTGAVFFSIGSLKSRWSLSSWWGSGLITLSVGAAAASLAYFCGVLLR